MQRSRRSYLAPCLGLALLTLACVAFGGAVRSYERPVAGVLVDVNGLVSSIGLPTWDGPRQGLRWPDRVVAIDGVPLASQGDLSSLGDRWDERVAKAASEGREAIVATVEQGQGRREVRLGVGRLEASVWWLYAGTMMLAGLLFGGAGVLALWLAPGKRLAQTFAVASSLASVFLLTFLDSHTTRSLVGLHELAYGLAPGALVLLVLRLPDDVPWLARWPALAWLIHAVGGALGLALLVARATNASTIPVRQLCMVSMGGGAALIFLTMAVRSARAQGERRQVLRTLQLGVVPVVVGTALFIPLSLYSSRASSVAFAVPLLAMPLTPLSVGVAVVRYDLWGTRALLSRLSMRSAVAALAVLLAAGAATALSASLGLPFGSALVACGSAAALGAALVSLALQVSDREFFPSREGYKPSIEQLSEELTSITSPDAVVAAVERTVRRWIPCETVSFTLGPDEPADAPESSGPRRIGAGLASKASAADGHGTAETALVLPVSFGGATMGWLRLGPKPNKALFTSEDLDLLRTIANQAALALAHARAFAELEDRRKQQAAAFRSEREAIVATITAEIAHEVRYPINFFRSVFQGGPHTLDHEEMEIGREEIERLERLVAGLRPAFTRSLCTEQVRLRELVERAEMLLRDSLGRRQVEIDLPTQLAVRCDPDQLLQIVVNLLSNALDAASAEGRLGVDLRRTAQGADLIVWDTGPGFALEPSAIFAPWVTTKPRGTGLGLAICSRLARAHGWQLDARHERGRTEFLLSIPDADMDTAEEVRGAA